MALVPPIYIAVMTFVLGSLAGVKKSFTIVAFASLGLFCGLLLFNGTLANSLDLQSNIVGIWVSFALLAGLLFAGLRRFLDA